MSEAKLPYHCDCGENTFHPMDHICNPVQLKEELQRTKDRLSKMEEFLSDQPSYEDLDAAQFLLNNMTAQANKYKDLARELLKALQEDHARCFETAGSFDICDWRDLIKRAEEMLK